MKKIFFLLITIIISNQKAYTQDNEPLIAIESKETSNRLQESDNWDYYFNLIKNDPHEAISKLQKALDERNFKDITEIIEAAKTYGYRKPDDHAGDRFTNNPNVRLVRNVVHDIFAQAVEERDYEIISAMVQGARNNGTFYAGNSRDSLRKSLYRAIAGNDMPLFDAIIKNAGPQLIKHAHQQAQSADNKEMIDRLVSLGYKQIAH